MGAWDYKMLLSPKYPVACVAEHWCTCLCCSLSLANVSPLIESSQCSSVRVSECLDANDAFQQIKNLLTEIVQFALCNTMSIHTIM